MLNNKVEIIYTIGFAGTTAENFFERLKKNNVLKLIDTRLNNKSQLSGFAKQNDLKFFLKKILNIEYIHEPKFAPTEEILKKFRKKEINWQAYEKMYHKLISEREVEKIISLKELNNSCLMCSESSEKFCHRKILSEYLGNKHNSLSIIHL